MLIEPSHLSHIQISARRAHAEQADRGGFAQQTCGGVTHEVRPMHAVVLPQDASLPFTRPLLSTATLRTKASKHFPNLGWKAVNEALISLLTAHPEKALHDRNGRGTAPRVAPLWIPTLADKP